jgi:hypothetical protein
MTSAADGVYGRRAWGSPPDQTYANDPSYEAYLTGDALADVLSQVRATTNGLDLNLFPPRFGYRVDALGINDIGVLDDIYERRDFTARRSGYSGTSTPALDTW